MSKTILHKEIEFLVKNYRARAQGAKKEALIKHQLADDLLLIANELEQLLPKHREEKDDIT